MADKNCIQGIWADCRPYRSACNLEMLCFSRETGPVLGLLKPQGLDGKPDAFTEAEKWAFSHALQRLEVLPGAYFPVTDYLGEIRQRLDRAYAAFEKRGQTPRIQRVWMTVDSQDEAFFRRQKTEPRPFLKRMRAAMEKYLEPYNVLLDDSARPPAVPHATLVFTPTDEALVRTRERRTALVESQRVFFGDRIANPVDVLLDSLQNVVRPDWSEESLIELAVQQDVFREWRRLSGGRALSGTEGAGNPDLGGFAFVWLRFPQVAEEKGIFDQTVGVAVHELGHLWGLDHPWETVMETQGQRKEQRLVMEGYTNSTEAAPPEMVWGEQAAAYLEVVLGRRK